MDIRGKAFSAADRYLSLLGIPMTCFVLWYLVPLAVRGSGDHVVRFAFVGLFVAFFVWLLIGYISSQFATIAISQESISFDGLFSRKKVSWRDVGAWKYPVSLGRFCYTPHIVLTLKDGRNVSLPCAAREIASFLIESRIMELVQQKVTEANQSSTAQRP